jgi:dTDP-4-dehydrorhamnose 3,5-epimerase
MGSIINSARRCKIEGVLISVLKQIEDERGAVLHMLRSDSPIFTEFGEIYFSLVNKGVVKAWKRHKVMTQRIAVPIGRIRLVLFDNRTKSATKGVVEEIILGRPDQYYLICIPPLLWYGFQGISESPALLVNCSDIPHDTKESERLSVLNDHISYSWEQI